MNDRYNGWANWETWVCNLWLGEMFYEHQKEARHDDAADLAQCLEEATWDVIGCTHGNQFLAEIVGGFMRTVDFRELAKHAIDDVREEEENE